MTSKVLPMSVIMNAQASHRYYPLSLGPMSFQPKLNKSLSIKANVKILNY